MEKERAKEFLEKFHALTQENQRYILAIEQALVFAQVQAVKEVKT